MGLEPPTFRLTAERASRLRHGGLSLLRIPGHCIGTEESKSAFLFPGESVLMYPLQASLSSVRYGLVVRIPGSHPGGPGSIPGNGITFATSLLPIKTKIYFIFTNSSDYSDVLRTCTCDNICWLILY